MSSTDNPYRPPGATVADLPPPAGDTPFAVPGVQVEAGRGASWISEGWALFKAAPLMWIVALLIFFGIQVLLGVIPLLGNILSVLAGPFFMAGLLAFSHGIARGEEADLGLLFIGLKQKTGPLLTVAALYFLVVVGLVVLFLAGVFVMLGGAALTLAGSPEAMMESLLAGVGILTFLLLLLGLVALLMLAAAAYWFAPGLVLYTDLSATAAMKESFRVCFSNWLPFLVFGVLGLLVSLGGMLLLVIGFFLLSLPVLMASYYASFRDIFGRQA